MQNDEQILLAALNRSGFPFQLGIDAEVANGFAQHGWTVLVSEHPYRSDLFDRGFVDSIFAKSRARVVVESKRWQGDWIFAVDKQAEPAFRARVFVAAVVDGPQTRPRWEDLELAPQSVESAVCVLRRGDSDSAETVEGIAANLAEATQMIGVTEMEANSRLLRIREFLFAPMIVTTARLVVARFDAKEVSLQEGIIRGDKVTFEIGVPFVRFRKPLSCARGSPGEGLPDINDDLQRTVFVVNSMHLGAFLKDLDRVTRA